MGKFAGFIKSTNDPEKLHLNLDISSPNFSSSKTEEKILL